MIDFGKLCYSYRTDGYTDRTGPYRAEQSTPYAPWTCSKYMGDSVWLLVGTGFRRFRLQWSLPLRSSHKEEEQGGPVERLVYP